MGVNDIIIEESSNDFSCDQFSSSKSTLSYTKFDFTLESIMKSIVFTKSPKNIDLLIKDKFSSDALEIFNLKLEEDEFEGEMNSRKIEGKPYYFNIQKEGGHITLSEVSSMGDFKMKNFKDE